MPDHDVPFVEDRLRALANRLDEAAPPLTAADITDRPAHAEVLPMRRRNPLLAAGGAALAVAAAVAGFVVIAGDDEPNRVDTAGRPGPTSPTPTRPSPDTEAGVLPKPADGSTPPLLVWNDEEMALIDYSGKEFGRAPLDGWSTNRPDVGVDLIDAEGGWKPAEAPVVDDPVEDCQAVHGRAGLLIGACGGLNGEPPEIVIIESNGVHQTLAASRDTGHPDVGHWGYGLPSPDAKWVLAQWSGECEVLSAYAVEVSTGRVEFVGLQGTESRALGWAPDGRAIVGVSGGPCTNAESADDGIYLIDVNSGDRQRIHHFTAGAMVRWSGDGVPGAPDSRLDRRVDRALAELNLEGCCGEPSHGREPTSTGMVFEGRDIEIYAVPDSMAGNLESLRPGQVRFTCFHDIYTLGVFDSSRASDRPLVQRAADRLRPHLYCYGGD
jgi:hypothetical protein